MEKGRKRTAKTLAVCGLMSAVICVLSPFAIPVGEIPVTLGTLAILLAVYLLGGKLGTASCLIYLLLGMAGLPVFSGFMGGAGRLLGPTGGYLMGYLPMAAVSGLALKLFHRPVFHFLGMAVGTALCYAFGTAWFCWQGGYAIGEALGLCVLPFVPFDLFKIAVTLWVGPILKRRLEQMRW